MKTEGLGFAVVALALFGGLFIAKSSFVSSSPSVMDPASQLGHATVAAISIDQAWVAETIGGQGRTAAYLTLHNGSGGEERLMGVELRGAGHASLHRTVTEDNVSRMEHLDALIILSGGSARLAPGGMHIMIMGLEVPLEDGDSISLTLQFLEAGDVSFDIPVRPRMEMLDHSGH